ncbi:hypothetical protein [Shewanella algae]|uniref:hypothetical protein n=1 Tax=Shewanella algae TaxID=38313 RepID=UPI001AAF042E|nr:hypothetical protein [Shewanella algae]EKT4486892.1 hypothetical protein [Shewanella algae]MBO2547479.1 hypothetical protein [Shewanella algae]
MPVFYAKQRQLAARIGLRLRSFSQTHPETEAAKVLSTLGMRSAEVILWLNGFGSDLSDDNAGTALPEEIVA